MNKLRLFTALSIGFLFTISLQEDSKKLETLAIGAKAPLQDYKMASTEGQKKTLKSLSKENGLIVVFSCNTCPFVIGGEKFGGWEKDYNDLYEKANQNGLGFVLVNSNEAKRKKGDNLKDMKERAQSKNYKMPYTLDKNHELADAFGAKTTPHIFMFDEKMTLVYEGSIDNTWDPTRKNDEAYLENAIQSHINNQKIETPKTAPKGCSIKRVN